MMLICFTPGGSVSMQFGMMKGVPQGPPFETKILCVIA